MSHARARLARPSPCTVEEHVALASLPRGEWMARTLPLLTGKRPVCESFGLEYGDCAACAAATGRRFTFSRRVRCLGCGAHVDGCDLCDACEVRSVAAAG